MVGVAGKSKGCTTCRRRKVGCDLQRPACKRCVKSGRTCEGYDRYPIFLNRTSGGVVKRDRLEEAKVAPSRGVQLAQLFIPQDLSMRSLNETQIIAWFWEYYAPPTRPADAREGYAGWLYYAISIPTPPPALRQALLALAVTRYGRATADDALFQRGRQIYSLALHLLQQVLYDDQRTWTEETLASVRSMVLYEFLESTSEDPTAWFSHLDGMGRLLEARGPRQHTDGMPRAILQDIRYPLMMKAIMQRKASVFGERPWLSEPWVSEKGSDQLVFDHGFLVASLLERADSLRESPRGIGSLTAAVELLRDCNSCHQSLQSLFDNELCGTLLEEWRRAERLILVLNLYTMQLLITLIMAPLCQNVQAASSFVPMMGRQMEGLVVEARIYIAGQESIVRKIKDGVRLCMDDSLGQYGPSRTVFPLNMLIWYHRHSKTDFDEVSAIKQKIARENQLKFAGNLNRGESVVPQILRHGVSLTNPGSAPRCERKQ